MPISESLYWTQSQLSVPKLGSQKQTSSVIWAIPQQFNEHLKTWLAPGDKLLSKQEMTLEQGPTFLLPTVTEMLFWSRWRLTSFPSDAIFPVLQGKTFVVRTNSSTDLDWHITSYITIYVIISGVLTTFWCLLVGFTVPGIPGCAAPAPVPDDASDQDHGAGGGELGAESGGGEHHRTLEPRAGQLKPLK